MFFDLKMNEYYLSTLSLYQYLPAIVICCFNSVSPSGLMPVKAKFLQRLLVENCGSFSALLSYFCYDLLLLVKHACLYKSLIQ